GVHAEAVEQGPDIHITVDVQVLEWVAVARQECLDTECCCGVCGADQQRVANALSDHLDPSMDQRRHQHFAYLGVCLNEGMHLVACELYDLARCADTKAHQRWTPEDHADVACELIGANNSNQEIAKARGPNHLYLTGLDNEEGHVGLAAFDQHLPLRDWTNQSV